MIDIVPSHIIWKDFGFENNYEDVVQTLDFQDMGPFTFDVAQYNEVFERIRRMIPLTHTTSRDRN